MTIIPTGDEGPLEPRQEAAQKPRTILAKVDLSDPRIEARRDMNDAGHVLLLLDHGGNQSVAGLRIRLGPRSSTWIFYHDVLDRGRRKITSKTLGHWPAVDVSAARRLAAIEAGRVAGGKKQVGVRAAVKWRDAIEQYVLHLRENSAAKGKPANWAKNVVSLAKHCEEFENWTLKDLSDSPADIKAWHRKLTVKATPVVANQAAKLMRSAYRLCAQLDRSLPPAMPTTAVSWNREHRAQGALDFPDFPKWREAWDKIESPIQKAFQKIALLTGCRPGELSRLEWKDVLLRERRFVIRNSKTGDGTDENPGDIYIPISVAIFRELRRAWGARAPDGKYVFPTVTGGHVVKFSRDGLPAHGMDLRRTYRTVCANMKVDEIIVTFLMGHKLAGVSRGYISKLILASAGSIRDAQRDVSRRIERLLEGRR
jgi:integrase